MQTLPLGDPPDLHSAYTLSHIKPNAATERTHTETQRHSDTQTHVIGGAPFTCKTQTSES